MAATQGPGLVGALLVGLSAAKALAAARELPFARGRSPPGSRRRQLPARARPRRGGRRERAVRAAVRVPDRQRRAHAARPRSRARRLRGPRTHARRCGRRGVRQGRADARPRLPRGSRARASGRGRGSRAFSFPGSSARARGAAAGERAIERSRDGLDFSFAGREDGAAVHAARAGRGRRRASAPPTSRPPTRPRSWTACSQRRRAGAGADAGCSAWRWAGAWRPTACCAGACGELGATLHVPARALCTDNAAMIASAARYGEQLPYPRLPGARRLRHRGTPAVSELTVYSKPDCHSARRRWSCSARSGRARVRPVERDITGDEDLHRAYFERIPVVAAGRRGAVRILRR